MTQPYLPYEETEHTADLGLKARGRTMTELFANAALGMLSLMGCRPGEGPVAERLVEIEGLDPEHLLVRWLSEILYLYREGKSAVGFEFERLAGADLRAVCRLAPLPAGFVAEREIKLVTHHGVKIERQDGLFCAEVVFDV